MKRITTFVKLIFDLFFFSFLAGSSLALFVGIVVELIYPKIVNEYWILWWLGWVIGFAIWAVITRKKELNKKREESDNPEN